MQRLLSRTVSLAACMLLGSMLAFAIRSGQTPEPIRAQINPPESYIYWGMNVSPILCAPWDRYDSHVPGYMAAWASCWHDDEGLTDPHSAIDYSRNMGMEDAGILVQLYYTGAKIPSIYVNDLTSEGTSTTCTGVRVQLYNWQGYYQGDEHYLHISPISGVIGTSGQAQDPIDEHWYKDLGYTSLTQPSGCGFTGPHLHQSGNGGLVSALLPNRFVNPVTTWEHVFIHYTYCTQPPYTC